MYGAIAGRRRCGTIRLDLHDLRTGHLHHIVYVLRSQKAATLITGIVWRTDAGRAGHRFAGHHRCDCVLATGWPDIVALYFRRGNNGDAMRRIMTQFW